MKLCSSKAYLLNNPRVPGSISYAISGALATVVHDAVMNPAEVVKQRMQMIFSPYGNSLECIRCIYIREGLRAFYRSYITQLTLNVPYQCTHFMIYEYMQSLLNPHHNYNPSSHFVSGGIAGGIAAAITTPFDCVKTVLNTQQTPQFNTKYRLLTQNGHATYYKGLVDGIRTIYYLRGTGGFFRGLQARIIFQVPSTALSWSAYELCKYLLSIR
uniref:Mitochondrial carrier protein n=1 Tax=Loa loa TaxID=7209 RepID=A0A1I7V9G7_LOALO